MSRIGKLPVQIPSGVKCTLEGTSLTVAGPKGSLEAVFSPEMTISLDDGQLVVTRPSDSKEHRSLHGLTRTLVNNMMVGGCEGL